MPLPGAAGRRAPPRGSGGMRASRPTFARLAAAIPVGRAFAVGRRGGIYPARGRWRRRRVARDDASIVPYRGCDHAKLQPSRLGAALPQICLPCQREVARPQAVTEGLPRLEMPLPGAAGRRAPPRGSGGMRASRPTFARLAAAIPVGRAFAVGRRGGIYPARGRWRRRRVARDDASIVPYRGCDHAKLQPSRLGAALPQICLPCQREVARPQAVTEGLPRLEMPLPGAAGRRAPPRGSGGMRASRPTFARLAAAIPVGRAFAVGRRGGIYPARGRWRRRRVARDDASIVPYRGCDHAKLQPSRLGAALPQICLPCQREVARPQAVTEGLPRLEMPLPGAAGRRAPPRGSGGMRASRPTFARLAAAIPVGRAFATVCRGGPWPSRGCLRRPGAVSGILPQCGLRFWAG